MELSKELIGKKLSSYTFDVERGKVAEFLAAIGEQNPLYHDPAVAREMGYSDTPVPPTFTTGIQFWGYKELWNDMRAMGIDTDRLLHMKEEYSYFKPIYPGTTIHASGEVAEVKTGKLEIVAFKTRYLLPDGECAIEAHMTILIRPEGM